MGLARDRHIGDLPVGLINLDQPTQPVALIMAGLQRRQAQPMALQLPVTLCTP